MREKIKEILKLAQHQDVGEGDISFEEFWSDQILTLICEEIEKVENPYEDTGRKSIGGLYELSLERLSFEECRQKILSLLQGKAKPPKNIIGSVDI